MIITKLPLPSKNESERPIGSSETIPPEVAERRTTIFEAIRKVEALRDFKFKYDAVPKTSISNGVEEATSPVYATIEGPGHSDPSETTIERLSEAVAQNALPADELKEGVNAYR